MLAEARPLFVRVPVAARLLGMPPSTLYRLARRGEVPSRQVGSIVLIPRWWITEGSERDGAH